MAKKYCFTVYYQSLEQSGYTDVSVVAESPERALVIVTDMFKLIPGMMLLGSPQFNRKPVEL